MPRIRPIKPDLLKSEKLYALEQSTGLPIRIAVVGLILCADREGRFEWRPRRLQTDVLPYDDCDLSQIMDLLASDQVGTLMRYTVDGADYGCFIKWTDHQRVRSDERSSTLPAPQENEPVRVRDEPVTSPSRTRVASVTDLYQGIGGPEKGIGGPEEGREHGIARACEARPGRVITSPATAPDLSWIAPTEKQLVMLTDKANQVGVTVQEAADHLGIPVAGINVGRIKDHLEQQIAQAAQARASPKTFAQLKRERTREAAAAELRRIACGTES